MCWGGACDTSSSSEKEGEDWRIEKVALFSRTRGIPYYILLYPVKFVTNLWLARYNRLSYRRLQVRTNGGKRWSTTAATATAALDRHGPAARRRPDPPGLLLVLSRPRHVRGVEGGRRGGRPQGGGRGTSRRRRRGTSRRRRGRRWRSPQRRRLRVRPGGVHLGAARPQAGPGEKILFNRIVRNEPLNGKWSTNIFPRL